MSPQEIQALIDAKIAGQGSAVDVGGALPQILSGILSENWEIPKDSDCNEQCAGRWRLAPRTCR